MSQRNESTVLLLALLATIALVGGGLWWLTERLQSILKPTPLTSPVSSGTIAVINCNRVQNVPTGLFNYGGSTTWATIRRDVDPVIQNNCPQFRLRYIDPPDGKPGSGTGIRMLLDNQLAFSQSSRSLKGTESQEARQKGFSLKEIPVAIDGIAIAVNPNLNLPGLTVDQLKGIYTGKITNWHQIGGPDLPVTPYSRGKEAGGTVDFFVENVLDKQNFGVNVEFISTTTEALQKLATKPGSIYYASAPEVVPQCTVKPLPLGRKSTELVPPYQNPFVSSSQCPAQRNKLNAAAFQSGQYPITRNLFVIVKQDGQQDQQSGEAYASLLLTPQGQELIEKAGFVRIR
jgi:phosphate transport system substrate-binding protein